MTTVNAGTIAVKLDLDDGGMPITVRRAGASLQELQGALNKTASSVKSLEDAESSLSTKFRHLVTTMGALRFVAMDVHDVFLRLPMAILKTSGELERTRALLSGLSTEMTKAGRSAEGAMNFDYIVKMAQRAPFEISALSDAFVKFKSGGIDPTNGSLQALADGVAKFGGTGETLKRASVAIQQMMGKGVISMEELRQQLGEAVPTAMADMASGMGISMAALTKAVSKGTVESSDALNKMFVIMGMRSAGAAQEMMTTWNGVTAQLKTRLQLAADEITSAGFGDAMKAILGQASEAMNSLNARQLTNATGEALGAAVTKIANFAKILMDHAELIKTAAMAWIAYKAASVFIGPAIDGVASKIKYIAEQYQSQARVQQGFASVDKAMALEKLQTLNATSRAQMTASTDTLSRLRAEMDARKANNVAMLASYNAANTVATSSARPRNEAGQFISRASVQEQVASLQRLIDQNSVAMRTIRSDIGEAEKAHSKAALAAIQHGNAIDGVGSAAANGSRGVAALGAAARVAGAAFNALGGWATVLNLGIAGGIYLWANWGKAAEEAMARSSRARAGLADQKDYEGEQKEQYEIAAKSKRIEEKFKEGKYTQEQYQKALDENNKKLLRKGELVIAAGISAGEENSRKEAAALIGQADVVATGIRNANIVKIAAVDTAAKEAIAQANGDAKKIEAISKLKGDQLKALAKQEATDQLAAVNSQMATLNPRMFDKNGGGAVGAMGVLQERQAAELAKLKMVSELGDNKFTKGVGDKGSEKAGPSPIEKLIGNMKERRADLEAEIAGFNPMTGKMDKLSGIVAKMKAQWDNGDLNTGKDKKTKPSSAQFVELVHEAIGAEQLKEKQEQILEASEIARKVTEKVAEMEPDYVHALALLKDPLSTPELKRANSWDVEIIKVKGRLSELGEATDANKSVVASYLATLEALKKGSANAKTIDSGKANLETAKEARDLVSDNKRLSAEFILDEREKARALAAIDNEIYKEKLNVSIKLKRLSGANVDGLVEAAAENTALRIKKALQDARTPMQKLADDWQNTTSKMEDASTSWASGFVEVMVTSAKTGKLEFGSLVESILADILRIQAQKMLAPALNGVMGAITKAFIPSTNSASMWGDTAQFADGGIMSSMGSVPLRKYAAGGVANSPQMALYGEGSMNEAFVPLPDGRTIPVTMSGVSGGAPSVTVNVINQSGAPVGAQQGQPRFDGKQMILDVVLTAANSPGGFRDGMKGALR